MNTSRLWISLIAFVGIVGGLLGFNLARGNTPVLGLDLRGGLSVIYATAEPASGEELVVVRDLMRDQLESFGIAEPDVRVEGENIVVDLPGVTDQEAAFDALQVSGIVELRPVIQCQVGSTAVPGESTTTEPAEPVEPESTDTGSSDDLEEGSGPAGGMFAPVGLRRPATPDTTVPDTTVAEQPTQVSVAPDESVVPIDVAPDDSVIPIDELPADDSAPIDNGQEILPYPGAGQDCLVGPAGGTGEVFSQGSAAAAINQNTGQWVVNVDLRAEGEVQWNSLATQCFSGAPTCPSQQLAIVLDGVIQSAPTVQTPNFEGSVQISGAFSEDEVRELARVLNRGAFPVPVEQQRVETVSATAGQDSLNAAIIAGLIGVALMLMFMVAYYRKLSIIIIVGLIVWGMTVFTLATLVSQATNYALTLAGATGIIVAVGVTVDTYVVYFERLRDEMRHGRTLRNAAPRSFTATWKTILAADFVSLLASIVLFWLSVGSVKGFALYLGLTTICDLLVFVCFTRPAVLLLSRTTWFDRPPKPATAAIGAIS